MRHFRRGGAGRSGGWCQTRQCLGSGRHSWEEAGRADADLIPGGRRVAASAPVTTACVPVSGRKPARWQVASAAWALRRALPRVFRRPSAQASVSGRALGPAAPVRRAWPRRCFGWLRPAPAGGPAQPPSALARRRVLNGVISGSSLETRRFLCSTSSLTGQCAPCSLVAGYFYFSAIFPSTPQMILSQSAVA